MKNLKLENIRIYFSEFNKKNPQSFVHIHNLSCLYAEMLWLL